MTEDTNLPDGTWTIDPDRTTLTVTVQKMKFISVPATLDLSSGHIEIANGAVTSVEVVADAASYKSSSGMRNKEVVGKKFLDAENHPTITFSASNPSATTHIGGTVQIKGKNSPIAFAITDLEVSDSLASFTATSTVDRMAAGVDMMPAFVIAPELEIKVSAVASK